jgi:UDP-N-acetylglucosamine 4,6-dehydratase/5-epimerase
LKGNQLKNYLEHYHAIDLNGATVLVTGGTGSFGKQFIKTILARYRPKKLIVFSRDEQKQFDMQHELAALDDRSALRFFIGDVRDVDRLEFAMRDVDYVIHAAALKHVSIAEYNPFECIQTNVIGAQNIVSAALRTQVKMVISLSTDKAANPVNLYGASKLAAEKIHIASNNISGSIGTKFAVIRYGNVLGSRGSVIPFFQKLIDQGASKLPITDPRMTRFWISLEQGVDFVLSAMQLAKGGEIFVPKIPSMKVSDIAKAMAPHLKHEIIGIRPGEKLHEQLITADESRYGFDAIDRFVVCPLNYTEYQQSIKNWALIDEGFRYSSETNTEWLDPHILSTAMESLAA